jgi:uncharacterized membrane protein YkvA (DUF1232 family)
MSSMSSAVRWMLLRAFEGVSETNAEQQMEAAASLAPRASGPDQVVLGLLQLLLPELVTALEKVIIESAHDARARRIGSGLLTYVCNPLDIIGDDLPLGRVDDVLICALGLKRLDLLGFKLTNRNAAICELAVSCLPCMREDIRDSIGEFVASLEADSLRAEATQPR